MTSKQNSNNDDDASQPSPLQFDENRPVMYINVIIEDPSEAIKSGVTEKIANNKALPPILRKKLGKHIGRLASNIITASKAAEKAAPGMAKEMPIKMKQKGLTIVTEPVFQEGPYFVIMMQVLHVSLEVMMEAKSKADEEKKKKTSDEAGDDTGNDVTTTSKTEDGCVVTFLKGILSMMGVNMVNTMESAYLPSLIQSKIQVQLDEMMSKQMYDEKKMKARCDVLDQSSQSRYFYAMLKEVREAAAAAKAANTPRGIIEEAINKTKNPFNKKNSSGVGGNEDGGGAEESATKSPSRGGFLPNPFKKQQ